MNTKRLFWRLYRGNPAWCRSHFALHWEADQLHGVLYAGITLFGRSLLYSDHWSHK